LTSTKILLESLIQEFLFNHQKESKPVLFCLNYTNLYIVFTIFKYGVLVIFRISIDPKEKSSEAKILDSKLNLDIRVSKVYTIDYKFSDEDVKKIADSLCNPVVETYRINKPTDLEFDWALELGFLPGVTDNVATTAAEIINDLLKIELGRNKVFTSKVLFIKGKIDKKKVKSIAENIINILIERYHIKSFKEYKGKGMDMIIPVVKLEAKQQAIEIDLNLSDAELVDLGKKGILDPDTKERRGPLAMDLDYLNTIKAYYQKEGRKPTDIELESIAQTWSEHCKHTIFSSEMDNIKQGIFDRYIRGATDKIRRQRGSDDFCLSVFKDNSGAIIFDDEWMITDKAETHNSPSALDPFGGAITGIVGVNRDTIGFGLGAMPIVNKYGYCFGKPEDTSFIYRGQNKTNPSLFPKRILEGVVDGVNVGGNCSGIPTPTGWCFFDDHYKGKPLVFVGTIGIMPRKLPDGRLGQEKQAQPGDNIAIIGGRVGKDGIHGATFSSEAMDEGSPATAVQIGDPITQKKLSDAVIKEARDRSLFSSNTDNGAGGLSCSVAEMAEECGGFEVNLNKVPLKYPGLQPWETWISESQERMTLSVPDNKLAEFQNLMEDRGVECTVIGKFNDSGRGKVVFNGKTIFDLDMDFLHNGLPTKKLITKPYPYNNKEPVIAVKDQLKTFEQMLGSHNICSFEFISKQYDHEVQNNSVIKPLIGVGRVNGTAQVVRPVLKSRKGLVISETVNPRLSEINCYDMAAVAIDTAVRNSVAVGADIDYMALLDNFCWCSSNEPQRLAQLKDAAKASYDIATTYMTPFLSGKDSMFNDFKGYDESGKPIKISVHPTLMISTIGVISDVAETMTMDLKATGDLIYVIGITRDEMGGSEFYNIHGELGINSPRVAPNAARRLYKKMYEIKELLSACASITAGGLLIALAKMSIAGQLGASVDIRTVPNEYLPVEKIFYSETQTRFIITIDPDKQEEFETAMKDFDIARIGLVTDNNFIITDGIDEIIRTNVKRMDEIYRKRFKDL